MWQSQLTAQSAQGRQRWQQTTGWLGRRRVSDPAECVPPIARCSQRDAGSPRFGAPEIECPRKKRRCDCWNSGGSPQRPRAAASRPSPANRTRSWKRRRPRSGILRVSGVTGEILGQRNIKRGGDAIVEHGLGRIDSRKTSLNVGEITATRRRKHGKQHAAPVVGQIAVQHRSIQNQTAGTLQVFLQSAQCRRSARRCHHLEHHRLVIRQTGA